MLRCSGKLTYANVMVTILAFIVLGGGTALASLVITSNSQVAAGTISGHRPPTGDRPNIISASVNGTDLATGSVGSSELATGAVKHAKLSADSVTSANVTAHSLRLSDLVGGDGTGSLSFSVPANSCTRIALAAPGAAVGQAALLTWTSVVPADIAVSPLRVVSSGLVHGSLCNPSSNLVIENGIGFRVITFG